MSKNILSLSLAVILSLSFLSACTKDSDSPKAPNVSRGEVRDERNESQEEVRGNKNDDVMNTQNQATPQPVTPSQDTAPAQATTPTPAPATTTTPTTPAPTSSQAKEATRAISYQVPDGTTTTTFTVNVADDGTISSVSSEMTGGPHDSQVFNKLFAMNIAAQVVGKKASDVASLAAVGGASLTTNAFKSFVASM